MGLFEQFPYTNFHELNLDWVINTLKNIENKVSTFSDLLASFTPTFYGEYAANETYKPLTIVTYNDRTYIAKTEVPKNVTPDNDEYWAKMTITDNFTSTLLYPDIFSGSDSDKLEKCFTVLKETGGGTILINRDLTLTNDVPIAHRSTPSVAGAGHISVIGIGKSHAIYSNGYRIYGTGQPTSAHDQGGVYFNNLNFVGNSTANNIAIDCEGLIRCTFTNCAFTKYDKAIYCSEVASEVSTPYAQQYDVTNCYFYGNTSYAIYAGFAYSLRIFNSDFDGDGNAIYVGGSIGCYLTGNLFEYHTSHPAITFAHLNKSVVVNNTYFESNTTDIDLSGITKANSLYNIHDCVWTPLQDGQRFIVLPDSLLHNQYAVVVVNNITAQNFRENTYLLYAPENHGFYDRLYYNEPHRSNDPIDFRNSSVGVIIDNNRKVLSDFEVSVIFDKDGGSGFTGINKTFTQAGANRLEVSKVVSTRSNQTLFDATTSPKASDLWGVRPASIAGSFLTLYNKIGMASAGESYAKAGSLVCRVVLSVV